MARLRMGGVVLVSMAVACGDSITQAGRSLERAAAEIAKIKDVDPVALNRLIAENGTLRANLQDAAVRMAAFGSGTGVIALKDRRVQLRVVSSSGAFRIRAWVNDTANVLWRAEIPDVAAELPFDFRAAILDAFKEIGTRVCGAGSDQRAYMCGVEVGAMQVKPEGHLDSTASYLRRYANGVFQKHLAGTAGMATGYLSDDVQGKLGGAGTLHRVSIEVTPEKATANGGWSLRLRLFELSAGGEISHGTYDFSPSSYPTARFGAPLPVFNVLLMVERANAAQSDAPPK